MAAFALALADASSEENWRQRLLDFVRLRPGQRLNIILKALGANRGTAKYHLRVLEHVKAIRVHHDKGLSRYFPASMSEEDMSLVAILLRGRILDLVKAITSQPGIGQLNLTLRIRMSRKVFREYADILLGHHLIEEVSQPHARRYFPTPRLAALLRKLEGPDDPSGGRPRGGVP